MSKRILLAGVLGAIALMLWTFVTSAFFLFNVKMRMQQVPNERAVYQMLKENVTAPGVYVVNPEVVPEQGYAPGEPVFGLTYAGFGHEAAGRFVAVQPLIALVSCLLAAWLLSKASGRVLSSYARKVCFVSSIGLLVAVFGDLMKFGIGGYPATTAAIVAAYDLVSWIIAGLVIAGIMRAPAES